MASKRCLFSEIWLQEPEFAAWLQQKKMTVVGTASCAENCLIYQTWGLVLLKAPRKANNTIRLRSTSKVLSHNQTLTSLAGQISLCLPPINLVNKFHPLWLSEQTIDV